jgi:hypothetical protein
MMIFPIDSALDDGAAPPAPLQVEPEKRERKCIIILHCSSKQERERDNQIWPMADVTDATIPTKERGRGEGGRESML